MASAQEAEQFIQSLNGYRTSLGKRVEHSAKRLLYELLRYINGKTFVKAGATKESPFLTFKIYPDRIIVDSNNDDLTKTDLQAICQPVNKEQSRGANFKAIVAATKRTHIQSGNFSFEFQHNIFDVDDSDTMRPVWVTPAETIPENVTRLTLYLHDQGSKQDIQNLRDVIISQFEKLEEESLLFLKGLGSLKIMFFDKNGQRNRSKSFRKSTVDEYRVSLTVTAFDEGIEKSRTQVYHIVEQSTDNLSTNVMLAFPLTDDFRVRADPKTKKLFNFVPLQASPLKFHIHADFDLGDDGQGTLATPAHNSCIQDQVSTALFKAILQFCEHPTLRYHWPMFLTPGLSDLNPLWSGLDADTRRWITQNPVLMSRHMEHWRHIKHLAAIGPDTQDEAGDPLFDDPISDPFLSSGYPPAVVELLKEYGLATLKSSECIRLLKLYFHSSDMKLIVSRTKEWYSAMARLLSKFLAEDQYSDEIKSLPLLKLTDGSRVSAASETVYFPTVKNIEIPESLKMRVLSNFASCDYPIELYQQLGVLEATTVQVRNLILQRFSSGKDLSLRDIKSYLRFLYLTHPTFSTGNSYTAVKVMTLNMTIERPWSSIVYLPGIDHPYAPQKLLGLGVTGLSHPLNYLHPEVLDGAPTQPSFFHLPWRKWLCDYIGIRETLSLFEPKTSAKPGDISSTTSENDVLSEDIKYVLKSRPDMFLGLIQHLWVFEGPRPLKSPSLLSEIQQLPAKDLCGLDRSVKLRDTWVPIKQLKDCVEKWMEYPDRFPFLKLEEEKCMDLAISAKWSFLTKHLGVKRGNDLDFVLEILDSIMQSSNEVSPRQVMKVMGLYTAIRARFSNCTGEQKDRALKFFEASGILYIDETGPIWTGTSNCLWTAPADMVSAYSLRRFYEDKLQRQDHRKELMASLSDLFQTRLGIRDAGVKDLVEELCLLRDERCEDIARVTNIYKYFDKEMWASPEMRTAFNEHKIILVKRDSVSIWLSSSECFWSGAETTPINSSLKSCYPDLKYFFLGKLGVRISAYDKLVDLRSESLVEPKSLILSLMDETNGRVPEYPVEPMRKAKVFPVSYPCRHDQAYRPDELCSLETEFAIGDRESLETTLRLDIKMLDFDVTEVRRMQPLFKWLMIEDRYLSRCVTERLGAVPLPTSRRWDLKAKAYHIARVGATFNSYGPFPDALSLYNRLRTVEIVEVTGLWTKLEIIQDDQVIESSLNHHALAYISYCAEELTIYTRENSNECFFSALPRKIQEWLMRDEHGSQRGTSFEVVNALTAIFASDVSGLDGTLEDLGIVKVPFENQDVVQTKTKTIVPLPEMDQREPRALVMRGLRS